eukprot:6067162-Pleurochrysis_carterae.AAC.1
MHLRTRMRTLAQAPRTLLASDASQPTRLSALRGWLRRRESAIGCNGEGGQRAWREAQRCRGVRSSTGK